MELWNGTLEWNFGYAEDERLDTDAMTQNGNRTGTENNVSPAALLNSLAKVYLLASSYFRLAWFECVHS
jgi:hypothetical protein